MSDCLRVGSSSLRAGCSASRCKTTTSTKTTRRQPVDHSDSSNHDVFQKPFLAQASGCPLHSHVSFECLCWAARTILAVVLVRISSRSAPLPSAHPPPQLSSQPASVKCPVWSGTPPDAVFVHCTGLDIKLLFAIGLRLPKTDTTSTYVPDACVLDEPQAPVHTRPLLGRLLHLLLLSTLVPLFSPLAFFTWPPAWSLIQGPAYAHSVFHW